MTIRTFTNPGTSPRSLYPFGPNVQPGGSFTVADEDLNEGLVGAAEAGILTVTPPIPKGLKLVTRDGSLDDVVDVENWVTRHDTQFLFDGALNDGSLPGGNDPRAGVVNTPQSVSVLIADAKPAMDPFSKVRRIHIHTNAGGKLIDPVTGSEVDDVTMDFTTERIPTQFGSPANAKGGVVVKHAVVKAVAHGAGAQVLSVIDPDATGLAVADTLTINWA